MHIPSSSVKLFSAILCTVSLSFAGCAFDGTQPDEVAATEEALCSIKCAAPEPGCRYENAVTEGRCAALTCGDVVCLDECSIRCEAPPPGYHYERQLTAGPCDLVQCGRLVATSECSIRCEAPPENCRYEGAVTTGSCREVTCGELVCAERGE